MYILDRRTCIQFILCIEYKVMNVIYTYIIIYIHYMSSIVIVYTHNAVHDHEVVAFPDLFDRIVPRFDVDRANKVCYLQQ